MASQKSDNSLLILGGVGLAGYFVYRNMAQIRESLDSVAGAAGSLGGGIGIDFSGLGDAFQGALGNIPKISLDLPGFDSSGFSKIIDDMKAEADAAIKAAKDAASKVGDGVGDGLKKVGAAVDDAVKGIPETAGNAARNVAENIIGGAASGVENVIGLDLKKTAGVVGTGVGVAGAFGLVNPISALGIGGLGAALLGSGLREDTIAATGKTPEKNIADFFKSIPRGMGIGVSRSTGIVLNTSSSKAMASNVSIDPISQGKQRSALFGGGGSYGGGGGASPVSVRSGAAAPASASASANKTQSVDPISVEKKLGMVGFSTNGRFQAWGQNIRV